jgi:hypothetical protein
MQAQEATGGELLETHSRYCSADLVGQAADPILERLAAANTFESVLFLTMRDDLLTIQW